MTTTTTTTTDTTDAATDALVKFVRDDVNRDGRRDGIYAAYVTAHKVTRETVAAHVKRLTETAYPGVTPSNKDNATATQHKAKNFQNKVRNGLNSVLGKPEKETDWERLVRQAAENANVKGGMSTDAILSAVADTLAALEVALEAANAA